MRVPWLARRAAGAGGRGAPGARLFGVVSLAAPGRLAVDGAAASARERLRTPALGTAGAELLRARDLGALVAPARFAAEPLTAGVVAEHRAVVDAVFAERAVLPAPPGTLFRTRAALTAWLELHAASLAEGLRFVEDRAEARVTALPALAAAAANGAPAAPADGADAVALAAEAFAALRRDAAALLVLRGGPDADTLPAEGDAPGVSLAPAPAGGGARAAFLVERSRWGAFAEAVAREGRRHPALRLACDGPWPPYSFVRLDFHG